MNILFVSGNFNDEGGRSSGYCQKLIESIETAIGYKIHRFNGGNYETLQSMVECNCLAIYDIIFWFANVPNDKPKLIREVKRQSPKCMLVTSKANYDGEYTIQDLVARALENKANLLVEFRKDDSKITSSIIDPLGNEWWSGSDIDQLSTHLLKRLNKLKDYTRIGSERVGDAIQVPDSFQFFNLIRKCADKFHDLIHGVNTTRMLGNASFHPFRCENGFPSMKENDVVFVSKRNVDKRDLGQSSFVACLADSLKHDSKVWYWGDHKPSVDTPIQLALYSYYKNIRYMIHSHVYVEGAPFTSEKIPCGAMEEAFAIFDLIPWHNMDHFAINLKGHGSIIAAYDVCQLEDYAEHFIARSQPERSNRV
jgi:ribulose-5-phosphate 4-epimerase/fuculose-1-phosphate aldolase